MYLSSLEGIFPSEKSSVGAHEDSTECCSFAPPTKEILMEEWQAKSEGVSKEGKKSLCGGTAPPTGKGHVRFIREVQRFHR